MAVEVARRRFTADEYQRMGQTGILREGDRIELIEGEILAMTPIGTRHSAAVDRGTRTFVLQAGDRAIVRAQGAVRLNMFNEPQPDLVLLRPREDFYVSAHPGPADIILIVEIAASSLDYDRDAKGPLYARMGVREYWLADLNDDVLWCYSAPEAAAYRNVEKYRHGQTISPQLFPGCTVSVDDLLAL